jgi:hypothetical protein
VVAPGGGGGPEDWHLLSGEDLVQSVPLHERSLRHAPRAAWGVVRLREIVEIWGVEGWHLDGGNGEGDC